MKETKFIRDNGLKSAEKIIKGVPDKTATHYVSDTDTYFSEEFHTYFSHSLNDWEIADLHCVGDLEAVYELVLDLCELKRLIESLDIIDDLEGIKGAKGTLYNLVQLGWDEFEHRWIDNWTCTKERLERAISDYESICQPKCEHGYDIACLLCGFGTVDGERVCRSQGAKNG